jgi:lipoyl(octanoyl) transferase
LSLNVDMDLEPFSRINPCGYPDMKVTQMRDLTADATIATVSDGLLKHIFLRLGYNDTDLATARAPL